MEIAIKVCRQASTEDALLLAQKHGMHDWYLKIQIEDRADYKQSLDYIGKLDFSEVRTERYGVAILLTFLFGFRFNMFLFCIIYKKQAETNMKKYGSILLQHCPAEATQLLKRLCTDYRPSNKPLVDNVSTNAEFLQHLIFSRSVSLICSSPLCLEYASRKHKPPC